MLILYVLNMALYSQFKPILTPKLVYVNHPPLSLPTFFGSSMITTFPTFSVRISLLSLY